LKKKSNSDIYHLVSFEGVCLSLTECSGILPEFPKYQNFWRFSCTPCSFTTVWGGRKSNRNFAKQFTLSQPDSAHVTGTRDRTRRYQNYATIFSYEGNLEEYQTCGNV